MRPYMECCGTSQGMSADEDDIYNVHVYSYFLTDMPK